MSKNNRNTIIAGVIIAAIVATAIIGALYIAYRVNTTGTIATIGLTAYADAALTIPATKIIWPTMSVGDQAQVLLWLKLTGNVNATYTLKTENWNPSAAAQHLQLTWNYTGQTIQPQSVTPVTLTLKVLSWNLGIYDYSFDITITATH